MGWSKYFSTSKIFSVHTLNYYADCFWFIRKTKNIIRGIKTLSSLEMDTYFLTERLDGMQNFKKQAFWQGEACYLTFTPLPAVELSVF